MTLLLNDASAWELVDPRLNVGGAWQSPDSLYQNVEGVWQQIYTRALQAGQPFGGGFFVGIMTYADGNDYALIDAGSATDIPCDWLQGGGQDVPEAAFDMRDGATNTTAMLSMFGSGEAQAATVCVGYRGGGFDDWYLPAFYEGELRARLLKPTTNPNANTTIQNPFSVPPGPTWSSAGAPFQTAALAYQTGGAQAFSMTPNTTSYWTSTNLGGDSKQVYAFRPFDGFLDLIQATPVTVTVSRPMRKQLVVST